MSRKNPLINASSMADIAFLLLVFFLVTTTIDSDKGLTVKLPILIDHPEDAKVNERNVLKVLVNNKDELMVNDKKMPLKVLKDRTIVHVTENAQSPKDAVVSFKNKKGTSYSTYVAVHNELKAAYNALWNEEAEKRFGKRYTNLQISQKKQIRKIYPYKISEAEPD